MLVAAFIHLLLVLWEEPDLRRRFGSEYDSYCQAVPRWVGRRRDPNIEGAS
jgi:protein-S-isoprenylcysteine O-methyltransferase Ste14